MEKLKHMLLLAAISFLMSACAGVFVTTSEVTYPSPHRSDNGEMASLTKQDIAGERREGNVLPVITRGENQEIWTYHYSNDWCGAFLIILPLMLPVCNRHDTYYFKGDILVKHERESTKTSGYMCSLLWSPCDGCGMCGPVQ